MKEALTSTGLTLRNRRGITIGLHPPSGEGMPSKVKDLLRKPWRVAENRWLRLFIKNTALC